MTKESSFPVPYGDLEATEHQKSEQDTLDVAYLRTIASQLCFNADMQPVLQVARTPFIHRTETAERTVTENLSGLALWIAVSGINAAAAWRHYSSDHKENIFKTSGEDWHADDMSGFQPAVDLGFSLYFPACVANAIVGESSIPESSRGRLTLTDWADFIDQRWFGQLLNTMAFGPPNKYKLLGLTAPDYAPGALTRAINDEFKLALPSLFEVTQGAEPLTQGQQPATIAAVLREELRKRRRKGHTCPGALKSMSIPEELASDPHARLFIEGAGLKPQPTADAAHSRYALASSTITQTLQALSQALRSYDEQFGTPTVSQSTLDAASRDRRPAVSHTKRKPLGLFAA